jgi:hypothetical protein
MAKRIIETAKKATYDFGDVVWYKLDENLKGIIVGIFMRANGSLEYDIIWCNGEKILCMEEELSPTQVFDYRGDSNSSNFNNSGDLNGPLNLNESI